MKWKKFTIQTTTQAEDLVCGMLMDLGIDGVEIEDRQQISEEEKQKMFIDILPELPADDGTAYVSFYVEVPEANAADGTEASAGSAAEAADRTGAATDSAVFADTSALLTEIRARLQEMSAYVDVGTCLITQDETEEEDWINNWKAYFQPFAVDDVLIKPSWHEMDDTERAQYPLVIEIDPGTSFGTGMHETTQLVLRALRKYVHGGTKLFDVGCGSGILSILALKLGAAHAMCMDIDPAAVKATVENMEANDIGADRYEAFCGNLLAGGEEAKCAAAQAGDGYDIVAANILADIIIPLTAVVGAHLKPGGIFITSGILDVKEAAVKEALLQNGFEIVETAQQNDWVSVIARKPQIK